MNISCKNCRSKFKIPDEKVPKEQTFSLTCPQCSAKVIVDTRVGSQPESNSTSPSIDRKGIEKKKTLIDEVDANTYDASDKPFDFVEEGVETALLCESDPANKAKIKAALHNMNYHITTPTMLLINLLILWKRGWKRPFYVSPTPQGKQKLKPLCTI